MIDQKKSSSMKHRLTKRWNTQKSTDKDDTIKRTNISLTGIWKRRDNGEEDIFGHITAENFIELKMLNHKFKKSKKATKQNKHKEIQN